MKVKKTREEILNNFYTSMTRTSLIVLCEDRKPVNNIETNI